MFGRKNFPDVLGQGLAIGCVGGDDPFRQRVSKRWLDHPGPIVMFKGFHIERGILLKCAEDALPSFLRTGQHECGAFRPLQKGLQALFFGGGRSGQLRLRIELAPQRCRQTRGERRAINNCVFRQHQQIERFHQRAGRVGARHAVQRRQELMTCLRQKAIDTRWILDIKRLGKPLALLWRQLLGDQRA